LANAFNGLLALAALWGGAIIGIAVGAAYFIKSEPTAGVGIRVLTSAFGPSLALLLAVAGLWWPESYRFTPAGVRTHAWLQLIPASLLVATLVKYPGSRRTHWLLLPLGLVAWAWTFALGWLFVHGE
jgi:hypothetical protein